MVFSIVESSGLRRLVMYRDPKVHSLSHKQLSHQLIPGMLAKTMQCFMLPALNVCAIIYVTSNLWMSHTHGLIPWW